MWGHLAEADGRGRPARKASGTCLAVLLVVTAIAPLPARTDTEEAARKELGRHVGFYYTGGLQSVRERRYLRVLTSTNSFDYFIYQGRHAGYQYEMVRAFTEHLNRKYAGERGEPPIQFELLPVRSNELVPMLLEGRADMIAARLTITPKRVRRVRFSRPYRIVDELLVGNSERVDDSFLHDLAGRRVAVRPSSSYHESLVEESRRLEAEGKAPIRIVRVDEALETEDILALVEAGHYELTVADSIVANTAVEILPRLRIIEGIKLREGGELAWASHPDSEALVAEMDEFLEQYAHGSLLGNVGVKRYFRDHRGLRRRLEDDGKSSLSRYDEHFRRFAEQYGFDWRLIAAVAYQESRFQQDVKNRWGAIGLFQLKAETAREPYVNIPDIEGEQNAANNVHAGVRYLAWIKQRYFDPIEGMRERDRLRMALAAYNGGPRTLLQARRRARKMGLDPMKWFRNVELALLAANKTEPVKYVSEINQRYLSYVMLGIE